MTVYSDHAGKPMLQVSHPTTGEIYAVPSPVLDQYYRPWRRAPWRDEWTLPGDEPAWLELRPYAELIAEREARERKEKRPDTAKAGQAIDSPERLIARDVKRQLKIDHDKTWHAWATAVAALPGYKPHWERVVTVYGKQLRTGAAYALSPQQRRALMKVHGETNIVAWAAGQGLPMPGAS